MKVDFCIVRRVNGCGLWFEERGFSLACRRGFLRKHDGVGEGLDNDVSVQTYSKPFKR